MIRFPGKPRKSITHDVSCRRNSERRLFAVAVGIDFFEVLDSVTIALSRKLIPTYFDVADIGNFPDRNKPISLRPKITTLENAINYKEVFELLSTLQLTIYTPTAYILPSKISKYLDEKETENFRKDRELVYSTL